ncbi:hypothetical protein Tco_1100843, partial [Tanacetum coccineum]
ILLELSWMVWGGTVDSLGLSSLVSFCPENVS